MRQSLSVNGSLYTGVVPYRAAPPAPLRALPLPLAAIKLARLLLTRPVSGDSFHAVIAYFVSQLNIHDSTLVILSSAESDRPGGGGRGGNGGEGG